MRVRVVEDQMVEISEMDSLCCECLQQIVVSARSDDHPAVQQRLYSSPTQGRNATLERDWKNYVEPDLREFFLSTQQVVARDLDCLILEQENADARLCIPVKHLDEWIHCLNQARLALATRYKFDEQDMDAPTPPGVNARSLALFKVHLYGFLQECFLRELD